MDLNKGSLSPVGPSMADTTLPPHPSSSHTLRLHLQTPLASRRPKTMMSEEYYNSWEEPSKYPRIPNVYEPIDGVPSRNAHDTNTRPLNRDKTKAIAVKLNIDSHRRSTSLRQSPDFENWPDQRALEDDQANWSVAAQLGSSYTWSDDSFNWRPKPSNPSHPPQRETDEQRRAKRQSSFEKWMNAGDKLFCHSQKARS
ncbi:hypothetical protein NW754_001260 [Fusarium falciforme]|nr:hypothetical protein NW754_001260 [Fusarium falciforme]